MSRLESDSGLEEFLTPEDYGGSVELDELETLNNHPRGDEDRCRVKLPEEVSDYRRKLVLEFGDLLTEPDETPEEQTRRIVREGYACRVAKRGKRDQVEENWRRYYQR